MSADEVTEIEPNALAVDAPADPPAVDDAAPAEAATETPAEPADEAEADETKALAKLHYEAREARRRTRALEREIQVLRGQREEQPDEEMDRKVQARAEELAAAKSFTDRCNTIYADGVKTHGKDDFELAIKDLNDALGSLPPPLIEAAEDAGEPAKLLYYLGAHTDVAEKLAALPPHRMGVEMDKLAAKLSATKTKAISKAPPPIKAINGNAQPETDPSKMSMREYIDYENKRQHERRYH